MINFSQLFYFCCTRIYLSASEYINWKTVTGEINIHVSHDHSGPTEVEDCSLPPPNMAATKTGEQGKA